MFGNNNILPKSGHFCESRPPSKVSIASGAYTRGGCPCQQQQQQQQQQQAREIVLAKIQNFKDYFEKYIWDNLDPSPDQPKYGTPTEESLQFKSIKQGAPPVYASQKKQYANMAKEEDEVAVDSALPTPASHREWLQLLVLRYIQFCSRDLVFCEDA